MDRGVLLDFTMTLLRKSNFVIGQLFELTFGCMLSATLLDSYLFLLILAFVRSSGQRPLGRHGLKGRRPFGPCSRSSGPALGHYSVIRAQTVSSTAQRAILGPLSLVAVVFYFKGPASLALGSAMWDPKGPTWPHDGQVAFGHLS